MPHDLCSGLVCLLQLTAEQRDEILYGFALDCAKGEFGFRVRPDVKLVAFADSVRSPDPVPLYYAQVNCLLQFCSRNDLPWLAQSIVSATARYQTRRRRATRRRNRDVSGGDQ